MKDLSLTERFLICCECCKRIDPVNPNKLRREAIREILGVFSWSTSRTIKRIWRHYCNNPHDANFSFDTNRKGKCGRKPGLSLQVQAMIFNITAENRGDITYDEYHAILYREGIEVCRKTVFNWCKSMGIFMESSHIKPMLTEHHRIERLRFVLRMISTGDRFYKSLRNHLHLDEKWFYLQPSNIKRKRIDGDDRPDDDHCQHKSHLTKVMFLCVIGCPWAEFDGKGAIMPIVEEKEAQRSSPRRPKGTIELKSYSLNALEFYDCMTMEGGVLEVIEPQFEEEITIQLDNASPHTGKRNIEALNEYCQENGLEITFLTQPSQSPDLNFCDGSFFNALQKRSFKLREGCTNEEQLVQNVYTAWDEFDRTTIEHCVYHMYSVFNSILEVEGGNQYDPPHAKVREKLNNGQPVNEVSVSANRLQYLRTLVAAGIRGSR